MARKVDKVKQSSQKPGRQEFEQKSVSSPPDLPQELEVQPESPASEILEPRMTSVQPTQVVQTWGFEHTPLQPSTKLADQLTSSDDQTRPTNSEHDSLSPHSFAENTPSSQCGVLVQNPGLSPHASRPLVLSQPPEMSSSLSQKDRAKETDGNSHSEVHTAQEAFNIVGKPTSTTDKEFIDTAEGRTRSSEYALQETLDTPQEPAVTASGGTAISADGGPHAVSGDVLEHEYTQSEVANSAISSTRTEFETEVQSKLHNVDQTAILSKSIDDGYRFTPPFSGTDKATMVSSTTHHRQIPEPPVTYETLKQPGESPQDTMRRLQAAKQREVIISIQQTQDEKGGHTANLAELKSLRNPLTPDQLKSLGVSASPSLMASNTSQLFPALTHSTTSRSPTPLSLHPPGQPVTSKAAGSNDSRHRPSPLSHYQKTTNSLKVADSKILSVYKNKLLSPWASDAKTIPQNEWDMAKEITTSGWATQSPAAEPPASEDSGSMYHMGIGCDIGEGRLGVRQQPGAEPDPIVGWDGQLVPPPVDWELRPRYSTDRGYVNAGFLAWLGQTVRNTLGVDARPRLQFERVPTEVVLDLSLHPDGIGFVPRDVIISAGNAKHYGYDITTDTFLVDVTDLADFDADGRVDTRLPENLPYKDETANMLIERKMQHVQLDTKRWEEYCNERKVSEERRMESMKHAMETVIEPPRPRVNLYLRPAVTSDIPGMTTILNWHIQNGVRTSELSPISEQDMQLRLDMAKQSKLPFIVAIERTRKSAYQKSARRTLNPNHPGPNTDPTHSSLVKDEHVVGWVSAVDWSCTDYVECISAELELYVAHDYRRKGIGRCLMDSLLDATDPGYTKEEGYDFTVAPEIAHMYNCGGNRQLHKLIFQVRTYNKPLTVVEQKRREAYLRRYSGIANGNGTDQNGTTSSNASTSNGKQLVQWDKRIAEKPTTDTFIDDLEDDYNLWLKKWLEKYGFEEESCLKKIGTKNRRFLDSRYLTRETSWQPADRKLPDYAEYPI